MLLENRVQEIKTATEEFLRRLTRWKDDRDGGPVVPEDVSVALQAAVLAVNVGDLPEPCARLQTSLNRMEEEMRGYSKREHGRVDPRTGAPLSRFWGAAKDVANARMGAETPMVERFEPVSKLLDEKVSYNQIGLHIYGRRIPGTETIVGPFLFPNQIVNVAAIDRQALYERQLAMGEEPTVEPVIPADWTPPWQADALEHQKAQLKKQLAAYEQLEEGRRPYDDPETVEGMLRDGCFVQQIMRAKRVKRAYVLEVAQRIGVKAVDGPDYKPSLVNLDLDEFDDELDAFDDDDFTGDSFAIQTAGKEHIKSKVIEVYEAASGAKGSAEIAQELRQAGYLDVVTNRVSAIIRQHKIRQTKGSKVESGTGA